MLRLLLLSCVIVVSTTVLGACAISGKGVKSQQDKIATSSESNKLKPSRNVNELKKYITLPYPPQGVIWLTEIKGSNTSTVPGKQIGA